MAPSPSPTVSVTIVLHNSERELERCLEAIRPEILSGFAELIAVDNASPDGSAGTVARSLPDARIIRSEENLGFAAGANLAWPHVRGRYWLLLNPDAELDAGGIERLAAWMDQHPHLGAASAELTDRGRGRTPLHRAGTAIALAGAFRGIAAPSPPAGSPSRPRHARCVLAWR